LNHPNLGAVAELIQYNFDCKYAKLLILLSERKSDLFDLRLFAFSEILNEY